MRRSRCPRTRPAISISIDAACNRWPRAPRWCRNPRVHDIKNIARLIRSGPRASQERHGPPSASRRGLCSCFRLISACGRGADMPAAPRTIDVARVIDDRGLDRFNYLLILLSWLITVFDGFDMMMISFTAPYMRDELGLDKPMLGNVFSAGILGM